MNIVVLIKLVPDLVEELTIDSSGAGLDLTFARWIINEFDDHALEQGILLKEKNGGTVTAIAPDLEGVDDVLFTAAARGADRLIKVKGDFMAANNHALARSFSAIIQKFQADLILTGVQAHNDLDGSAGPLLAECLQLPYVGYIAGVSVNDGKSMLRKEYPGGLLAEMEVTLPAVLGIQAAEQPPRYVAVSKVRQAMKTSSLEEMDASDLGPLGAPTVGRMFQPEATTHAEMIEGSPEEVSAKLVGLFKELGVM
ncbi:MAG: electron transfer flavoprotein subunit beta/FixA family protein [Chloroflexi bacterium]|nr:electron transfer flavoprotein subunit beta/FixA family protein [Chloroflexota bacterium]MDL1942278.1 electron transfer flavoprotein subunit beta/FixA family protein [Chloroflexi bacterium CFX2]